MDPPSYEEFERNFQAGGGVKDLKSWIIQIDVRLSEMKLYDPVECPEYLMEFEQTKFFLNASVLEAAAYKSKMDGHLDRFRKSKETLISKAKELEESGVEKDDMADYIWKEELCGVVTRRTIKHYYDVYWNSTHMLVQFMQNSSPVDGEKFFVEKNKLMGKKIDLLIQLRQLELKALLPESVE